MYHQVGKVNSFPRIAFFVYENVSSNQNNVVPRNVRIEHMCSKIELRTQTYYRVVIHEHAMFCSDVAFVFSHSEVMRCFGGTQEIQDSCKLKTEFSKSQ